MEIYFPNVPTEKALTTQNLYFIFQDFLKKKAFFSFFKPSNKSSRQGYLNFAAISS